MTEQPAENEQELQRRDVTLTIAEMQGGGLDYGLLYSHHSHGDDEDHVILQLTGGMEPDDILPALRMLQALLEQPDVAVQLEVAGVVNGAGHGE